MAVGEQVNSALAVGTFHAGDFRAESAARVRLDAIPVAFFQLMAAPSRARTMLLILIMNSL
jgi:hypothetical protein